MSPAQLFERVLEIVKKRGVLRTSALAQAIGWQGDEDTLDRSIAPLVAGGKLITCGVQVGDKSTVEYRLSMSAGGALAEYHGKTGRPGREPDPVMARLKEWGAPPTESAAPAPQRSDAGAASREARTPGARAIKAPPTPAAADQPREKPVSNFDRIAAAFSTHGPMRVAELHKKTGINGLSTYLNQGNTGKPQRFAKLGGGVKSTIWGLPGQSVPKDLLEAGAEPVRKDTPPRSIHRRKKHGKKAGRGAGGGSAAMRRKRAVKTAGSAAARKAWKTRRAQAKSANGFRPALAADGAILFLGAKKGNFEIRREDARTVVGLVRRLSVGELAVTVDFIERLDKAEVGAA